MARRVIGDAVRIRSTDVFEPKTSDQEFAQLEHARGQSFDSARERGVALCELGIGLADSADAGSRRRYDHLHVLEDTHEAPRQAQSFRSIAGVEVHLSAAGLSAAELDLVTKPLEQPDRRYPRGRAERIGQAGDEE